MKRLAPVIIGFFLFQLAAQAAVPVIEREALVALYESTDGAQWWRNSNWLVGDPCADEWYGITCDENESIKSINLKRNRLRNSIPPELGNLSNLYSLDLRINFLKGPIPPELGNLVNLRFLYLSENYYEDSIPAALGNLTKLHTLHLGYGRLSGSIPTELGKLTNLHFLSLEGNQLSGAIPAEIGGINNLEQLHLNRNQLSGPIPPELGKLSNLVRMWLQINDLSGPIPSEFGQLSSLEDMWLDENQLSGAIPVELANLGNLEKLRLGGNLLSGPIPFTLGSLPKLERLDLHFNRLSGQIPAELGNLTALISLTLFTNQLSGEIPPELGKMSNLFALELQRNQLSGSIPVELGDLPRLHILDLGSNQLSGPIPAELGRVPRFGSLYLQDNQLSGAIPPGLGNSPVLTNLNLANNQLAGAIPAELGKSSLWTLELQGNRLSGQIPESFFELTSGRMTGRHGLNLRWNALHTDDEVLDAFLDGLHKFDEDRKRDWSITQTTAPSGVAVTDVTEYSITLGWEPIEYIEEGGGYRVWYGTSLGGPYMDGGITADKTSSSHTVSGLIPSQMYYLVVTSETERHDDNLNTVTSNGSTEVFTQTTTATWPTSVKATAGKYLGLVQITFNPVAHATVYRVFRCLDMHQTCGSPIGYTTTASFDDRQAIPGTVYFYRVRACIENTCGKFSAANTGFAAIQLSKPTGIRASDGSHPDRVEISWNAVEGASVYRVFSCLDKGQTCQSPIGFPTGTSFSDKMGAAGTVYYYRVKACNAQQCSKFSVANAGHRSDTPSLKKEETNAFLLPGQQVPIPTLSEWAKWFLVLTMLGVGFVFLHRQYVRNSG